LADQIKKKLSLKDVLELPVKNQTVPGVHALKDQRNAQYNYGNNNYITDNPLVTNNIQQLNPVQIGTKQQKPAVQQTTQQKTYSGTGGGAAPVMPQTGGQTLQDALLALKNTQSALEKAEGARPGDYSPSADLTALQGSLNALEGKRPAGYTPDQAVMDAQNALQNLQKPGEYQSRYDAQINGILNTIAGAKEFNYQAAEDPMYRMYRDTYLRMGQRAAEDAMANASALTGGYGSSYGQMAANQANQNYIAELNNQMPTLMQMAYQRHQDQIADNYNQLNAFQSAENMDYGKYRDTVGDYQTERQYLANRYDTEYSKDYQEYRDLVGDYNDELMYMYGKYNDMSDAEYQRYMNNMDLWLQDRNYWLQKHGLMQDQANYMQEWEYKTRPTSGSGGGGGSGSGNAGTGSGNAKEYQQTYRNTNWPTGGEAAPAAQNNVLDYKPAVQEQSKWADYTVPHMLMDDGTMATKQVGGVIDKATLGQVLKSKQQTQDELQMLLEKYKIL
jgi:hypothetical protein